MKDASLRLGVMLLGTKRPVHVGLLSVINSTPQLICIQVGKLKDINTMLEVLKDPKYTKAIEGEHRCRSQSILPHS